jgi:opacity protein-like surface antigen
MNRLKTLLKIIVVGLILAVGQIPGASWAGIPDSDREGRWEFYIPMTYSSSESFDTRGGTSVSLNGDVGLGVGFAYNFNELLSVGFELTAMDRGFEAVIATNDVGTPFATVHGTLDSSNLQLKLQYNILKKAVTPFIDASLGSTYVDSNIPNGPLVGTCWWDPWFGYICDAWQPTASDSSFSYGFGAGVRGQMTDTFYLELRANQLTVDFDGQDSQDFSGYRLNIGWMF